MAHRLLRLLFTRKNIDIYLKDFTMKVKNYEMVITIAKLLKNHSYDGHNLWPINHQNKKIQNFKKISSEILSFLTLIINKNPYINYG